MGVKGAVKHRVLQRDARRCVGCQVENSKSRLSLHHILPQRLCGPDEMFNLVCLCQKCHKEWHQIEEKRRVCWDTEGTVREFFFWLGYPEEDIDLEVEIHLERVRYSLLRMLRDILDPPRRSKSRKKTYINRR